MAENNRKIEEAQKKLVRMRADALRKRWAYFAFIREILLLPQAEERLAMVEEQRKMEEEKQRLKKEQEKRVKEEQKRILGKNKSRPKLSFSLKPIAWCVCAYDRLEFVERKMKEHVGVVKLRFSNWLIQLSIV